MDCEGCEYFIFYRSLSTAVTLKSKQMGEVIYIASGRGLAPLPMEPLSVSASVGSNTSLILPFRNPTDVPVLADITMVDNDHTINDISSSVIRWGLNDLGMESEHKILIFWKWCVLYYFSEFDHYDQILLNLAPQLSFVKRRKSMRLRTLYKCSK